VSDRIGRHRIKRRRGLRGNSGLFFRLHFKFPLPFLKVCKTFRQRLILFAQLFGLILDVRKLVGMAPLQQCKLLRAKFPVW
jgi:hypothetical protein